MTNWQTPDSTETLDIAIVGMAGRFPGADQVDAFWRNLRDGVESITFFTDEELKAFGVNQEALHDPSFVKAGATIAGADLFDAGFFGYSPKEAEIIDPQHRVFLEAAWEAVEKAGYRSDTYNGLIGVFAGASMSTYLLYNLLPRSVAPEDSFQAMIGNDKDFLSTRASYELDLKGPSVDVQTACSTSLVAVHMACQSLLGYQCDMALAGGVSIQVPQRLGYYFQPGGINSPDGHCRPFDAQAQGTIFGSGVGVVALKRLADALADHDTIHAIIKGSAVNNDGSSKIGYTAPSIEGQARVIAMAQSIAEVEPETISYIEAHGTGTALGDPIEIRALEKVFRASTEKRGFCAIGSVKSNIGHLDAAAGVAGLIKTVLALKHRQLPPSLHFDRPNPQIDFASSPFYVNHRLSPWPAPHGKPRRAGVSSFGVGGTNAHLVLEEAPAQAAGGASRAAQALVVSARSHAALERQLRRLSERMQEAEPELDLADVAYTLAVGRRRFEFRAALVASNPREAVAAIEQRVAALAATKEWASGGERRPVVFMFPGGGAQHPNMGLGLYHGEEVFRREIDACCELLKPRLGYDIRRYLYPPAAELEQARRQMLRTSVALPALYLVEYALARQLQSWGIEAEAMIGHSLGEYVAATLCGVMSVEQGLGLVAARGELFEELEAGAMLSVAVGERQILELLGEGVSIAALNGPEMSVISGEVEEMERAGEVLTEAGVEWRRLQIEVAAHSRMVERIAGRFEREVRGMELGEARQGRYVSNVSGDWVGGEQREAGYWVRHLRETVRFGQGLRRLVEEIGGVCVEVGPGQGLSSLAKLGEMSGRKEDVIATMRHPQGEERSDEEELSRAIGQMWERGVEVDWGRYYEGEKRRRVELPGYAFERMRYWIGGGGEATSGEGAGTAAVGVGGKREQISEWFYMPCWRRRELGRRRSGRGEEERRYVVFGGEGELSRSVVEGLRGSGEEVIEVRVGESYEEKGESGYVIRAGERGDYERLVEALGGGALTVAHLWGADEAECVLAEGEEGFAAAQRRGFYSLLYLAQALAVRSSGEEISLTVVTQQAQDVESGDEARPERATALGPVKVIRQEMERVSTRSIDLGGGGRWRQEQAEAVVEEVRNGQEFEVAYRGRRRYVRSYEKLRLERAEGEGWLKSHGVYVVVGGSGGIGRQVTRYLSEVIKARVIVVSRGVAAAVTSGGVAGGGQVVYERADISDRREMAGVLDRIHRRFGSINGVFHLAGLAGEKAIKLIGEITKDDCESHFVAKAHGCYVLEELLRDRDVQFCLLFSSNAAILGGLGSTSYSAANLFMDAFASNLSKTSRTRWISANWDGWLLHDGKGLSSSYQTSLDQYAMAPEESLDALARLLTSDLSGQVVISTGDLDGRLAMWLPTATNQSDLGGATAPVHSRPHLTTELVPPSNDLETAIVEIWQAVLGIDRLGINDNFFDLGGNSLIGIKFISMLKKKLGVEIPIVALFEGPTVKALAKLIGEKDDKQQLQDESRQRGERRRERMRLRAVHQGPR